MKRVEWIVIGLLAVSVIGVFWNQLFNGAIVGDNDIPLAFLPIESIYKASQDNGQIPWWTPSLGFGHPALGWGQLGFFIPVHVILRALHVAPVTIIAISPAIYTAIGIYGMYCLLRYRKYHPGAAGAAGAIFGLNGFVAGHLLHTNFYVATMVAPWLLLALVHLIAKPSLGRSMVVALVAGIIAESGGPPVVFFVAVITAIAYGGYLWEASVREKSRQAALKHVAKSLAYTALAGALGFGLAAIRLLPFLEFVELTGRWQEGLSLEDLYDFSVAPWHAITLIIPRFFWTADQYWGPKGFIEMSAFTGMGPLLLAGMALMRWRPHRAERIIGVSALVVSVILSLGKYSAVYRWLMQQELLATIGGTGRYVYVGLFGIALLTATALQDWLTSRSRQQLLGLIIVPVMFFAPFLKMLVNNPEFQSAATEPHVIAGWWEAASAAALIVATLSSTPLRKRASVSIGILAILLASFVVHHGDFYSLTSREKFTELPFKKILEDYRTTAGIPPRIYARQEIWQERAPDPLPSDRRPTKILSPNFHVLQPVHSTHNDFACLVIPTEQVSKKNSSVTVEVREEPLGEALRRIQSSGEKRDGYTGRVFCFEPIKQSKNKTYWILLEADGNKPAARALAINENDTSKQAYFIRAETLNKEVLEQSRKNMRILMEPVHASNADRRMLLLESHAQAITGASSARWWGSLPDERYRLFIEKYFANSGSLWDGEGRNVVESNRKIIDMSGITHISQLVTMDATDVLPTKGFEVLAQEDWWGHQARLYKNTQAYDKLFVVPTGVKVESFPAALEYMDRNDFDPHKQAVIEGEVSPEQLPKGAITNDAQIQLEKYENTYVRARIQTSQPSIAVLNDTANPQWITRVDGIQQPQLIGNGIFRAAHIPPGEHTVEFVYDSPASRRGTWITVISAVCISTGAITAELSKRRLSSQQKYRYTGDHES